MENATNSVGEFQLLRALCDESVPREQRLAILDSLQNVVFPDAEHQVVFESIRFLILRGSMSIAHLGVHLNNRGFPDVDVEQYFPPEAASHALDGNGNVDER
jgi:hypothetical protein